MLKNNNYKKNFWKDDFTHLVDKYDLTISKIKKVEQIKISTKEELIKLIKDGFKYKIINKNLCELICIRDKLL